MYHTIIMTVCSKAEETRRTGGKCSAPLSTMSPVHSFLNINLTRVSHAGNGKAQRTSATQFAVAVFVLFHYWQLRTISSKGSWIVNFSQNTPQKHLVWQESPSSSPSLNGGIFWVWIAGFSHAATSSNLQQWPIHLILLEVANLDQTQLANLLQICYCSSILLPHYIPIS